MIRIRAYHTIMTSTRVEGVATTIRIVVATSDMQTAQEEAQPATTGVMARFREQEEAAARGTTTWETTVEEE